MVKNRTNFPVEFENFMQKYIACERSGYNNVAAVRN